MERLFVIDTGRVVLTWSAVKAPRRVPVGRVGLLRLTALREGLVFGAATFRAGVPLEVAREPAMLDGPILQEQSEYEVYVRAGEGRRAALRHEDPELAAALHEEEDGRVLHGIVDFGGHIGRSTFTLTLDGVAEVAFEVEVFPSKLDYASDYEAIVADVQEIATALGLVYLASTRQAGVTVPADRPTELEWALLLRGVLDTLERALRHVARHPLRGLTRRPAPRRAGQVQRADAAIRAAVERGRGEGGTTTLPGGLPVRERLPTGRPTPTLDTPEHRWLAAQLAATRRRLGALRRKTAHKPASAAQAQALAELDALEVRLAALIRLEPLAAVQGEPPPGFTSQALQHAPGYREAYGAFLTLRRGLRIAGGPLALPVKDLPALYEMWCFLTTLRILAAVPGVTLDLHEVFRVHADGLDVNLVRGQQTEVRASGPGGRTIVVAYDASIQHPLLLTPQRPDLLLTVEDRGWPRLSLVLDAKYRLDDSPAYVARYGAPGPPDDALNVLHRYRDAILEPVEDRKAPPPPPKRSVVQAAAAYPYRPPHDSDFAGSLLYQSLGKVGIGAIPLLPGGTELLERWLRGALLGGSWALAETAPRTPPREHALDWRRAAAEPVLIGALRGKWARKQLAWVLKEKQYYAPLVKTQRRQFVARAIGLYEPGALRRPDKGAVTYLADVHKIEVKRRDELDTTWPATLDDETMVLVYHLLPPVEIKRPIENTDGRRMGVRTWSSRLAVDRATELGHLVLETEPEWRLHETLTAHGIAFSVEATKARVEDPTDPHGRALFHGAGWRARYGGSGGFAVALGEDEELWIVGEDNVLGLVERLQAGPR